MKLPAKVEYALRATSELALRYRGETPIHISVVSEAQNIPKNFLLQILIRLKNAGIVNSSRGISGGYFLARQPGQISLAEIVQAVDNSIIDKPRNIKVSSRLVAAKLINSLWNKISSDIASQLNQITLEDLLKEIKQEQLTYYI